MKKIIYVVFALVMLAACNKRPDNILPPQIIGYWTTDTPGYENRYLKLEKDFVLIGINPDETPSIQRVIRVESEQIGRETAYTIYSSGHESDYQISLYFDPLDGGIIRIKNKQGILWRQHPEPKG